VSEANKKESKRDTASSIIHN